MSERFGLLLTPREASNLLGVDTVTVARYVTEARLTHVVLPSGERRYIESELIGLLKGMTRKAAPPVDAREFVSESLAQSLEVTKVFDQIYDSFSDLAEMNQKRDRIPAARNMRESLYDLVRAVEFWARKERAS